MKTIWSCPDAFISRRHCAILVHASRGCELHDTASKNGTFLNEAKLAKPTRLKCGDKIRVCDRQFIFLIKGQPLPAAPSSQTLAAITQFSCISSPGADNAFVVKAARLHLAVISKPYSSRSA